MILINGAKYSCLECVRGHRSSLCRHHMRPLLQVRSKGRPNDVLSTGNKNHRIAVFAEEIALSPEPEPGSCKKLPVVILKASDKHIIDLSSGQIVGPYKEEEHTYVPKPVVRPDSFVNSSSCCGNGVSKARKMCGCNQRTVSKSKILKTYLTKKQKERGNQNVDGNLLCCNTSNHTLNGQETVLPLKQERSCCSKMDGNLLKFNISNHTLNGQETILPMKQEEKSCCSKKKSCKDKPIKEEEKEVDFSYETFNTPTYQSNEPASGVFTSESGKEIFEVINIPGCSIPGSCSCSSDCTCPNCEVHNSNASSANVALPHLDFLNDSEFSSNLILTQAQSDIPFVPMTLLSLLASHEQLSQTSIQTQSQLDEQESTLFNSQLEMTSQGNSGSTNSHCIPKSDSMSENVHSDAFPLQLDQYGNRESDYVAYFQLLLNSTTLPQGDTQDLLCTCPEDACFCNNCEKHGIIEGYKLDDILPNAQLTFQ